jgi:hypothetical protein
VRIREKLNGWVAAAKQNERRWMLAQDVKWIADSAITEDELRDRLAERLARR